MSVPEKTGPTTGRAPDGRFQGGSGNPGGRPRGSRNKSSLIGEALLEDQNAWARFKKRADRDAFPAYKKERDAPQV